MESSLIHRVVSDIDLDTEFNQPTTVLCETYKNGIHQCRLSFFIPKIDVDSSVEKHPRLRTDEGRATASRLQAFIFVVNGWWLI